MVVCISMKLKLQKRRSLSPAYLSRRSLEKCYQSDGEIYWNVTSVPTIATLYPPNQPTIHTRICASENDITKAKYQTSPFGSTKSQILLRSYAEDDISNLKQTDVVTNEEESSFLNSMTASLTTSIDELSDTMVSSSSQIISTIDTTVETTLSAVTETTDVIVSGARSAKQKIIDLFRLSAVSEQSEIASSPSTMSLISTSSSEHLWDCDTRYVYPSPYVCMLYNVYPSPYVCMLYNVYPRSIRMYVV